MLDYHDYSELSAEFIAAHPMDDPRFEPWLEAWYGPPLAKESWKREPEEAIYHPDPETLGIFIARSWSMGRDLIERFGVEPTGQTIWNLSNVALWPTQPERGERMMWDAVNVLFAKIFEPNADDTLCHLSEPNTEIGAALYMFWDFCGWWPPDDGKTGRLALVNLIERSLASSKAAVQESVIHGIGEFVNRGGVPELKELAHRFIADGKTSRPELFDYAAKAAVGEML